MTALDWMDSAACAGMDPERFFPDSGNDAEVKRVCMSCPVRAECLDYALSLPFQVWGIWAGVTERPRRAMRHQRMRGAA